jgi:hypothetical protein
MMAKHFEVESEINPRYLETGSTEDYYGLYHVVEFDGDKRIRIVATYSEYTDSRRNAYKHAAHLQALENERAQIKREIEEFEQAKEHYRRDQNPDIKWD